MKDMVGGVAPDLLWVGFIVGVLLLLAVDLILLHGKSHTVKMREAILISLFWISLSLIFNAVFWFFYGHEHGMEFLAGYLIEKSLSVDNIFVMYLIFNSLRIPSHSQHRVLFWGILGAIVMRGAVILAGASLIQHFHVIIYLFGGLLVYSAYRFLTEKEEEEYHPEDHMAVKFLGKFFPISHRLDGERFFTIKNHKKAASPLLVALLLIETTDIIFAVDSIPAVFSVTLDPFIAFSSNIMAILGLRALYFVVARWVHSLRYLKPGLAILLMFVGIKMLISDLMYIPVWVSLTVIASILFTATVGSFYADKRDGKKKGKGS